MCLYDTGVALSWWTKSHKMPFSTFLHFFSGVLLSCAFTRASFSFMSRAPCNGKKIVPAAINKDCGLCRVRSDHDFWTETLLLSFSNAFSDFFFFSGCFEHQKLIASSSIILKRRRTSLWLLSPKLCNSHQNNLNIFYFGLNLPFKVHFFELHSYKPKMWSSGWNDLICCTVLSSCLYFIQHVVCAALERGLLPSRLTRNLPCCVVLQSKYTE